METSLARQLEQLRTTSTAGDRAGKGVSVASSGPSIVDLRNNQELTNEQLDILANECFNQLSGNSGLTQQSISVLEKFRHLVFKEIRPDTVVDGDEEKGINTENLLIILAPHLLGPIAIAAYSYMALVPLIQPPIIKFFTTKKERQIVMPPPKREVSKRAKILFPIICTIVISILVPKASPLVGILMFGNLMRECGVVERLSSTAQNELMNIVVRILGLAVGSTMPGEVFLKFQTIAIFVLGLVAFITATIAGILLAKLMNLVSKEKINPMIGAAGVSAVPMAARVVQEMAQKEKPGNMRLMHAMGPNIAGVIGTATVAGVLLSLVPGLIG